MLREIDIQAISIANSVINLDNWGLGFVKMHVAECSVSQSIERTDSKTDIGQTMSAFLYVNEQAITLTGVKFLLPNPENSNKLVVSNSVVLRSIKTLQMVAPIFISLPKYYTGLGTINNDSISSTGGGDDDITIDFITYTPIKQETQRKNFAPAGILGG